MVFAVLVGHLLMAYMINNESLRPCYRCKGTGKIFSSICSECMGDGWVSKWFWKKQILEMEDNNLVALERIVAQEDDDG